MSSTYCTQANMNAIFGTGAITKWSDIDGDADATKKAARITEAINAGSDDIDDALRAGRYSHRIPIVDSDGNTPASITRLAAVLAGLWLYGPKALANADEINKPVQHMIFYDRWSQKKLEDIRSHKIELGGVE